jgi:hypothetical protein
MDLQTNIYYNTLTTYGNISKLSYFIENPNEFVNWTEKNFQYVRYNPRKNIDRWGLSITSLDGGLSGRPDLDSLTDYNYELGNFDTADWIKESDIKVPTPVYNHPEIKKICDLWQPYLYRTHVLKLNPGGFFPPHRDHTNLNLHSFRLIIPLQNCTHPGVSFILDDKILNFEHGYVYFIDTAKVHQLFNATMKPSYWIVMNIETNENTVKKVISNFQIK